MEIKCPQSSVPKTNQNRTEISNKKLRVVVGMKLKKVFSALTKQAGNLCNELCFKRTLLSEYLISFEIIIIYSVEMPLNVTSHSM